MPCRRRNSVAVAERAPVRQMQSTVRSAGGAPALVPDFFAIAFAEVLVVGFAARFFARSFFVAALAVAVLGGRTGGVLGVGRASDGRFFAAAAVFFAAGGAFSFVVFFGR